ncbi:hypothetical protein JNUCC74_02590 [Cerasibacillus sp. JNUCC 74]
MNVKKVKYFFLCLYLILLVLNVTIGVRNAFWILMGMVLIQTIAYAIVEKLDKDTKKN